MSHNTPTLVTNFASHINVNGTSASTNIINMSNSTLNHYQTEKTLECNEKIAESSPPSSRNEEEKTPPAEAAEPQDLNQAIQNDDSRAIIRFYIDQLPRPGIKHATEVFLCRIFDDIFSQNSPRAICERIKEMQDKGQCGKSYLQSHYGHIAKLFTFCGKDDESDKIKKMRKSIKSHQRRNDRKLTPPDDDILDKLNVVLEKVSTKPTKIKVENLLISLFALTLPLPTDDILSLECHNIANTYVSINGR